MRSSASAASGPRGRARGASAPPCSRHCRTGSVSGSPGVRPAGPGGVARGGRRQRSPCRRRPAGAAALTGPCPRPPAARRRPAPEDRHLRRGVRVAGRAAGGLRAAGAGADAALQPAQRPPAPRRGAVPLPAGLRGRGGPDGEPGESPRPAPCPPTPPYACARGRRADLPLRPAQSGLALGGRVGSVSSGVSLRGHPWEPHQKGRGLQSRRLLLS